MKDIQPICTLLKITISSTSVDQLFRSHLKPVDEKMFVNCLHFFSLITHCSNEKHLPAFLVCVELNTKMHGYDKFPFEGDIFQTSTAFYLLSLNRKGGWEMHDIKDLKIIFLVISLFSYFLQQLMKKRLQPHQVLVTCECFNSLQLKLTMGFPIRALQNCFQI